VKISALFSGQDTYAILSCCEAGENIRSRYVRQDPDGSATNVATWDAPSADFDGGVGLVNRLARLASDLLRDSAIHFHTKYVSKPPLVGGSWQWHQDYWNWYHLGFLTPDMVNICIALDSMDEGNGCLEFVPGSHKFGRLDHALLDPDDRRLPVGDSRVSGVPIRIGVDPDRLSLILTRHHSLAVALTPGDVVAFHGNSIHRSGVNRSPRPRRALICCFYAESNAPVKLTPPTEPLPA